LKRRAFISGKPSSLKNTPASVPSALDNPCQSCGACCATSRNWPRFSTEDDAALDLIPEMFVNERQSGMKCDGDRCTALTGTVGEATACEIYDVRPDVCRACMPGDPECAIARRRHGLAELVVG
jgi:Fe-S-cluster containining protein